MDLAALAIVGVVFVGAIVLQLLRQGPELWALFGIGAIASLVTGTLGPGAVGAAAVSSLPVVLFLLGLFLLTAALDRAGAIDHLSRWLLERPENPTELPLVLFVGIGLIATIVVNDALVVLGVPVLVAVSRRLRTDAKPLLLVLAFSVTVGSTLTPWGNPQNLLVATQSGLAAPFVEFLRYLAVPTALNLLVGALYLRWAFRSALGGVSAPPVVDGVLRTPLLPRGGWGRRLRRAPVLAIFPLTIGTLIVVGLLAPFVPAVGIAPWAIALGGAAVVVLLTPRRLGLVRQVNWRVLALFVGLFVVVATAVSGGVIAAAERVVPIPGPSSPIAGPVAIIGASLVGPQVVSNVPWVALQIPILHGLGYGAGSPIGWMALAAGSTLAGNLTLIGAASNLIVLGAAEEEGVRIDLRDFAREGIPLAAMTIGILLLCLLLGL